MIKDVLMQYIVIFIGVFTILVVLFQYAFTCHLLQPLSILLDSMKKLKRGKTVYNVHLNYEVEIITLIDQFNELAKQLKCNKKQWHQLLSGKKEADFWYFNQRAGNALLKRGLVMAHTTISVIADGIRYSN